MSGGKSKSSATTTSEDNRVVADAGALAVGAGANVTYTYTQGLDERAAALVSRVLDTVSDIAGGAGSAVTQALETTKTVAERQQNIEAPSANVILDVIRSPVGIVLALGIAAYAFMRGKK